MPELPEVEIMTENLRGWIAGRRLRAFELVDATLLLAGDPEDLRGRRVGAVRRVAKYTVVELGDRALVLHYRMTGKTVPEPAEGRVRARLVFSGRTIAFQDSRRLGEAWILAESEVAPFFESKGIGPEPWPAPRPAAWWRDRFRGLRGPIKPALLRQDRVSGLGNIAASEILWRARVHPTRAVDKLTTRAWSAIARETPVFLQETIDTERAPVLTLVEEGGDNPFDVYDREGEPCPRCRRKIQRIVQAARSTYFCPRCQR
jgi:formamidopyrimidine-DNA glycosylase